MAKILTNFGKDPNIRLPDLMRLLEDVICYHFDITYSDLLSSKRKRKFVYARRLYWIFLKDVFPHRCTFYFLANIFNRNHTTVFHNYKKHHELIETKDPNYLFFYEQIRIELISKIFVWKSSSEKRSEIIVMKIAS